ncbi:MAG: MerR family transcriptional regulator [Clostridia bacterium]|nr:MerR family transcriptional regulator [Clostridia bacterium]
MIKIGNMAKICGVNTQTLRYYDAEGVLRPEATDKNTGYRLYSPSDIEKFRKIQFYKSLGFELNEIKELFTADGERFRAMMIKRKNDMLSDITASKENVRKIDELTRQPEKLDFYALIDFPFTDDPGVVGKWELCGQLTDKNDMSSVTAPSGYVHKEIPFLPGGAFVWIWFWTKGVLYRILSDHGFAVPNPYTTTEKDGVKYMTVEYFGDNCIENGDDPVYLLYKQTDDTSYTEKTVRKRTDDTDLPFVDDPRVSGEWRSVDFVRDAGAFDPSAPKWQKKDLWISSVRFTQRGVCVKTVKTDRGAANITVRYTKGFVLNDREMTAERYEIKEINGEEYLFLQHKSGDYTYGGCEPMLYVFRRG